MRKSVLIMLCCAMLLAVPLAGAGSIDEVVGFWKTMDPKEEFVTSVMAVFRYEGRLYGRIIVSYDEQDGHLIDTWLSPGQRIEKLPSKPLLLATDLFWGLSPKGEQWEGGKVLDPRSGRIYGCDCWVDHDRLVLRGRLGPFGMRHLFHPATISDMPDGVSFPALHEFTPAPPST